MFRQQTDPSSDLSCGSSNATRHNGACFSTWPTTHSLFQLLWLTTSSQFIHEWKCSEHFLQVRLINRNMDLFSMFQQGLGADTEVKLGGNASTDSKNITILRLRSCTQYYVSLAKLQNKPESLHLFLTVTTELFSLSLSFRLFDYS